MSEKARADEMRQISAPKSWGRRLPLGFAFVALIVWGIGELASTGTTRSMLKRYRAETVSHARCIGLALLNFQEDYGSYPCEETAIEVKNNNPDTPATLGNASSNDFFRQLIVAGAVDQETPFFARTLNCRKPDNVMSGSKLLEKGEAGFAYVVSHATCKDKDFPIILTPLVKGTLQFDYRSAKKFFDGKVVVLSTDNACVIHHVDKDGHVWINGKDFFDPSQPLARHSAQSGVAGVMGVATFRFAMTWIGCLRPSASVIWRFGKSHSVLTILSSEPTSPIVRT